ncbi:MAG: hypothetical protein DI537_33000 [Stutzerimonas stutzeri]|nr:MAG: hypothetical protein DI537_33000 [Stutzerimonas stutzeri]
MVLARHPPLPIRAVRREMLGRLDVLAIEARIADRTEEYAVTLPRRQGGDCGRLIDGRLRRFLFGLLARARSARCERRKGNDPDPASTHGLSFHVGIARTATSRSGSLAPE